MSEQKPPSGSENDASNPLNEPPYPANSSDPGTAPGSDPPAGPPPGSPQAPPPGSPQPPPPNSPDAPAPGPTQEGYPPQPQGYPPQPYPQQQPFQQQPYAQQQQPYPQQQQQTGYPPQPLYPQSGMPAQQPGYPPQPQGYRQPPVAVGPPKTPRPPLPGKQKRSAMIAGAVGLTLMTLGFSLIAIPLIITVFGTFIGAILASGQTGNPDLDGLGDVRDGLGDLWAAATPWLIGAFILGVVIWVLGYLASIGILRRGGVSRPAAVTWSALGISIVASWILSAISSPISGLLPAFWNFDADLGTGSLPDFSSIDWGPISAGLIFFALLSILFHAGIGLLAWWWMAHVFRDRAVSTEATTSAVPAS